MVSASYRDAIADRQSAEVAIYLMTISHPDMVGLSGQVDGVTFDGKLRLAAGVTTDITSRGDLFIAFGYYVVEPEQGRATTPVMKIGVDNVDQRITAVLRSITTPANVLLEEVLESSPDIVERAFVNFDLVQAGADVHVVEATLSHRDYSDVPCASQVNSPATTPGIY